MRPTLNQIDDLLEEIQKRVEKSDRILSSNTDQRMAEELTKYLTKFNKCRYIHSDVDTLERVEILHGLERRYF